MTLKQLGEFADQKTLQDYAELHGLEYAWEGTSAFRKRPSPRSCVAWTLSTGCRENRARHQARAAVPKRNPAGGT